MNALTLSAARGRKSVQGQALAAASMAAIFRGATKMLAAALRAVFSPKVSMAVGTVVVLAMWWHNISIVDAAEASHAVATDALAGMPWAFVWAFRASRRNRAEEGGAR